jgi:hypothetical protein
MNFLKYCIKYNNNSNNIFANVITARKEALLWITKNLAATATEPILQMKITTVRVIVRKITRGRLLIK